MKSHAIGFSLLFTFAQHHIDRAGATVLRLRRAMHLHPGEIGQNLAGSKF